jgi:hypothetical protein
MNITSFNEPKPRDVKATWTPVDLAQAVVQAHPEWVGQALDARLLGQALREAFTMLRLQVDAVDVGTVAVPALGRFQARRPTNNPEQRRVHFLTPQGTTPGVGEAEAAPALPTTAQSPAADKAPAEVAAAPDVQAEPVAAPAVEPAVAEAQEPAAAPAAEPEAAAAEVADVPVAPAIEKAADKTTTKSSKSSKRKR